MVAFAAPKIVTAPVALAVKVIDVAPAGVSGMADAVKVIVADPDA